jgi:hypothetical protein
LIIFLYLFLFVCSLEARLGKRKIKRERKIKIRQ